MALADQLAQGIQFAPPPDPFAQYGKMQQLQAGQTQNALAQYQLGAAQRADEVNTNFLRGVQSAGGDEGAIRQAYMGAGKIKEYQDFLKSQAEAAKLRGETANLELTGGEIKSRTATGLLGNKLKIAQVAGSILRGVKDQATYDMAKQSLGHLVPDAVTDYPAAFDPAFIASEMKAGQTLTEGLAAENAARVAATGERNAATSERVATTGEGNSAFQKQKFKWEKDNPGHTLIQDESGNYFAANTRTNTVTPLMVAGSAAAPAGAGRGSVGVTDGGRPMVPFVGKSAGGVTEGERKAATLMQRLQFSQSQLTQALVDDPNAAKPGVLTSALAKLSTPLANTLTPEARQRVESAQLDMLDAALTLGTGAAYTKEQLEGYRNSYFPSVGDGPTQVKDKKARLENVIAAAKTAAGKAAKLVPPAPTVNPAAVSDDRAAADKILGVQ